MLCFLNNPKKDNTNLKTKNNQNCQKIKLYGSPTTKELKKKHSSRLVVGVEMDSQSWMHGKGVADGLAGQGGPTFACG